MTQRELMEKAASAAPEKMQEMAIMTELAERLAPELYDDMVTEMGAIVDYASDKCKEASFKDVAQAVAIGAGVSLVAGVGGAVATDLYESARRGLTKARNWKRIMTMHPNLKEEVPFPDRIKPAFSTLHHYAPDLMSDPMVGGAMLRQLASQAPGMEHEFVKKVLDTRKSLLDTRMKGIQVPNKIVEQSLERPLKAGERGTK